MLGRTPGDERPVPRGARRDAGSAPPARSAELRRRRPGAPIRGPAHLRRRAGGRSGALRATCQMTPCRPGSVTSRAIRSTIRSTRMRSLDGSETGTRRSSEPCSTSLWCPGSATSMPTSHCGGPGYTEHARPPRCPGPGCVVCSRTSGRSWPRRSEREARHLTTFTSTSMDKADISLVHSQCTAARDCPAFGAERRYAESHL